MLTFAKLANELIYVTKLTNEDLVNILLACVYEPLDLKDKNGNPYYAGKGECSYLLKGKRDVKLEIQRGTSKKEVIDHAEAYFERFIVSKILPSLLNDFLENMRMIITYDSSISESNKKELLSIANRESLANFLANVCLYAISRPNTFQDETMCTNNLPEQNKYFSGRIDVLKSIDSLFNKEKNDTVSICQTISGLGGIGKTQLSIQYAYNYHYKYKTCIWFVDAESSSSIYNSFSVFVQQFNLFLPKNYNIRDLQRAIKAWLSENRSWLLILDNLETVDTILSYLPDKINGQIIITTRNTRFDYGTPFFLDVFDLDEALIFMKKRLSKTNEGKMEYYKYKDFSEKSTVLIKRLGYLPLALEQAAAYIKEVRCSISDYLELLKQSSVDAFSDKYASPEYYTSIVTSTWNISFAALEDSSQQLLNLCAYMGADNIPVNFFVEMRNLLPDPLKNALSKQLTLNRVVTGLRTYSLASGTVEYINIHRLVQEVVRKHHEIEGGNNSGVNKWLQLDFNMLESYLPISCEEADSVSQFMPIAIHAESIAEHYSRLAKTENLKLKMANLYDKIGDCYDDCGIFDNAFSNYLNSLQIKELYLGKRHSETAIQYDNIGLLHTRTGSYSEAIKWHKKAISILETSLGKKSLDTAIAYNNLGLALVRNGDYDQGISWYQKCINIELKILGDDHIEIAADYNNIGEAYHQKHDEESALKYLMLALKIKEKQIGCMNSNIAITYNNLGSVYWKLKQYDNAIKYTQKSLNIYKRIYGEKNQNFALEMANLASILADMGKLEKARHYYMKAIEVEISRLGLSHPQTAKTIDGMGTTYLSDGQIKFALPYFLLAYKLFTGNLNQKHSDVMLVYNHLQIVHQKMEILQPFENWLSIQLKNSIQELEAEIQNINFYDNKGQCH